MNKKIIGIFIVMLLIIAGYNTIATINEKEKTYHSTYYDPLDGGWVEIIDGVKILHVSGSYYDMGYQYGYLMKDEIWEVYRGSLEYYELLGISIEDFIQLWEVMKDFIPQEYKEEAKGFSNGSGLPLEEAYASLVSTAIIHDISACSVFSAWGSATKDGKLYQTRSMDWYNGVKDPQTGKYVYDNQCLMVRNPDDGYASLCPILPSTIGFYGGINEKGIAINAILSWSNKDRSNSGIPMGIRILMVLDKASNTDEAIEIIDSNTTRGWNLIISDGKIPIGYAVEQTANFSYIGTWDNSIESNKPFWEIKDVVRRGNLFINPDCAAQQRRQYYPWSFIMYLLNGPFADIDTYDPYNYWYYPQWMRYKALSYGSENILGTIDLKSSIQMIREVYRGETLNLLFRFKLPYIFSTNTTYQWTACPETGDFAISFSSGMINAHENDVHYLNFYELLESEPP